MRLLVAAAGMALSAAFAIAAAPEKSSAEESAAIFKAAGFKAKAGKHVRCEDDVTASYTPGSIELQDLNGDGTAEAWAKEGSLFCYGNTAEYFVLLGKDAKGGWTQLLESVGVPMVLEAKSKGWPDIEVGGPGAGPFPVYRYNGKTYAKKK